MDIDILRLYIHVVRESSFTIAANRMGMSRSMVSKHIAALEEHLGARLLTRSTRSVRPTEIGQRYYTRVKAILDELSGLEEEIRASTGRPRGKLRIGASVTYALRVLNTHIIAFMQEYPEVELDLVLDECAADPVAGGLDAVIRIGDLPDSSLRAKKLHSVHPCVVASPRYLQEAGVPKTPADLINHRCLHFSNMPGAETWPFSNGQDVIYQKIRPAFSANNADILRAAAIEGQGISVGVSFMLEDDIRAGRLVQVLPEFMLQAIPVHLLYSGRRHAPAALLAFIDFLGRQDFTYASMPLVTQSHPLHAAALLLSTKDEPSSLPTENPQVN